jgi:hypothetical protein
MTYDQRCYDLALVFLEDEIFDLRERAAWAHRLAQEIQSTIETTIEDVRCRPGAEG